MVKTHEKYGSKGFRIVSVSNEDASKVGPFVPANKINYFTAVTPRSSFSDYGIRSYPTMMLVGADGKIVSTSARGLGDAQIEKMIADLLPQKVDVKISKAAKKAGKAYDGGDFGKALAEVKKLKAKEGVSDEDLVGVDRIEELIGLQVKKATETIESLTKEREYLELDDYIDENEKAFKDTEAMAAFEAGEKTLKDKTVKKEVSALKKLNKAIVSYKKAGNNVRKQLSAIKSAKNIIKKNQGMKAAEKAENLVSKWEAALPEK